MDRSKFVREIVEKSIPLRFEGFRAAEIAEKLGLDRSAYRDAVRSVSIEKYCLDLKEAFDKSARGRDKAERVRETVEKTISLRKSGKSSKQIADILDIDINTYYECISTRAIRRFCPDLFEAFSETSARKRALKDKEIKTLKPQGLVKDKEIKTLKPQGLVFEATEKLVSGIPLDTVYEDFSKRAPIRVAKILALAMRRAARMPGEFADLVTRIKADDQNVWLAPHEDLTFDRVFRPEKTKKESKCAECGVKFRAKFLTVFKGRTLCRKCMCTESYDILEDICVRHQNNQVVADEALF